MRLPIQISLDKSADEMEAQMREAIRKDDGISSNFKEVPLIIFVHPVSGAVGFIYEAMYTPHKDRYDAVLDQMGWVRERVFSAPTCHAAKLRRV